MNHKHQNCTRALIALLLATHVFAQSATCAAPFELGTITSSGRNTLRGDTTGSPNALFGAPCANAPGPELVIRFTVPPQTTVAVSFQVVANFDSVLVLTVNSCSYANAVGCNDDDSTFTGGSTLSGNLVPATYYLIVDGFTASAFGAFTITYNFVITGSGTLQPPPPPTTGAPPTGAPPAVTFRPPTPRPSFETPSPPSDRSSGSSSSSSAAASSNASASGSKSKHVVVAVVASIGGVALFLGIGALLCCCCRPNRHCSNQPTDSDHGAAPSKPTLPAEPFGAATESTSSPYGGSIVTTTSAPQPTPPVGGYWPGESYALSHSYATPSLPVPLGEVERGGGASVVAPVYPPPAEVSIVTPTTHTTPSCQDSPGFRRPPYLARQREQQGLV